MKKSIFLLFALFVALSAVAQEYHAHYQSATEPQTLLPIGYARGYRHEIILPNVNGYTAYKADLHIHTTYSDGSVNVKERVNEAWRDGLDIYAATDHMSIRPVEGKEGQTTPSDVKAKRGAKVTKAVEGALKLADDYGLLVIPGVELTGNALTQGHFNALFTTNNKDIYDYDAMQTIRNARKQGALIMHNHPGWRHPSLEMTKFEADVYAEKLIDGIEIMNSASFYPRAIDVAKKNKFFVTATTDIHPTTANIFRENGQLRNMTIVFAKELSLGSVREALESRRTLAYSFGTLAGDEKLLKDFFEASIETKKLNENKKKKNQRVMLTNKTSLPFVIRIGNGNPVIINPMSSVIVGVKLGSKTVDCTVLSMWHGMEQHPEVKLKY